MQKLEKKQKGQIPKRKVSSQRNTIGTKFSGILQPSTPGSVTSTLLLGKPLGNLKNLRKHAPTLGLSLKLPQCGMRKIVVVLVALLVLVPASVASAHDPIILTSEQTTPASGPLLVDGTISFALYGSLESSTDTRGFRVQFQDDDPLYLSILIPDLAPENELGNDLLPTLEVLDPTGAVSTFEPTERVTFAEPYTGTNYVRLLEYEGVALGGIYEITIKGKAASRFTVSVGKIEQFGTAVEDIDNRDLGVAGVMTWYMPKATDDVVAPADSPSTTSGSSTSMVLVVLVAVGLAVLVGARVLKARRREVS